jgi:Predicted transcriptional regulators
MTQAQKNGKKLTELRGELKQEYIAKVLNISASAISMYETGKRTPRDEIKKALAKYYGTTVEKLFYE